ncbi:MAG: ComF family protein [Thermoanaerobaculia bacterium]
MIGIARALAGFLLPSGCLACRDNRVESFWEGGVCAPCWQSLPEPEEERCQHCDEPLAAAEATVCGRCLLDPPAFRSLRAAAPYRGSARDILIAFKFRRADYLAPHLAQVMARRLELREPVRELIPVPATARARRWSDHAAELLAAALAARLRVPCTPHRLEKVRETDRQSGLPASRRAANVRRAFRARGSCPPAVLLVDDVATSSATVRECARVLRAAGAKTVDVWCFARASRDDALVSESSRLNR